MVTYDELPGWHFDVDEVSAGVYKVVARDDEGRSVEATGTNPDELLRQCKERAMKLVSEMNRGNPY